MLCHVLWLQALPSPVRVHAGLLSRTLTCFQEEFYVSSLAETVVLEKEQSVFLIKRTANQVHSSEMSRPPQPPAANRRQEDSTRRLWDTFHLASPKTSWMSRFRNFLWLQAEPLAGTAVLRMVIHADTVHDYRVLVSIACCPVLYGVAGALERPPRVLLDNSLPSTGS